MAVTSSKQRSPDSAAQRGVILLRADMPNDPSVRGAGFAAGVRDQVEGAVLFEYKVLTERDSVFAGRFDPASLERALNDYAAEGWRVIETFLAASLWKSAKAEIMVILERSKDSSGG